MKLGAGRSVKKLDQQLWLLRAWILKGSVSGEEERMNPGNLAKKINPGETILLRRKCRVKDNCKFSGVAGLKGGQ